jgi:hypothetical protein
MAPRFTSGLKFWQIYHNPTWRRKKTLKKRETLEIFNDLNIVKNVKWEASEVFMMLYTMFNGTRLEASIANFTGGYMEICQWLIGNGNNWLIYIGVNSVNIVCVCTMLSESFRCLFYRVPMCTHALSGHLSYQYRWWIQRGPLPQPHLWWIYMKTSDMNNYQLGAVSARCFSCRCWVVLPTTKQFLNIHRVMTATRSLSFKNIQGPIFYCRRRHLRPDVH